MNDLISRKQAIEFLEEKGGFYDYRDRQEAVRRIRKVPKSKEYPVKFVNPKINEVTLIEEPKSVVTEEIRKIICDKYGLEGDCIIEEMIDDIYYKMLSLEIW